MATPYKDHAMNFMNNIAAFTLSTYPSIFDPDRPQAPCTRFPARQAALQRF
jgi:hypothetical protein